MIKSLDCKKIAQDIQEGKRETVERNEVSGRPGSEKRENVDVDERKSEIASNSQLSLRLLAEIYDTSLCMVSNIVPHFLNDGNKKN